MSEISEMSEMSEIIEKILIPTIIWYQSKNNIFLTVEIADIQDQKIDLMNHLFSLSGFSNDHKYEIQFELFEEIDPEKMIVNIEKKSVKIILHKKVENMWTYLTKEKNILKNHIKIDWNYWVDEDAESDDDEMEERMNQMRMMQQMQQMGNNQSSETPSMEEMMRSMGGDMEEMMKNMGDMGDMSGLEDGEDEECNDEDCDHCIKEEQEHEQVQEQV
jgi:hypothetical protein